MVRSLSDVQICVVVRGGGGTPPPPPPPGGGAINDDSRHHDSSRRAYRRCRVHRRCSFSLQLTDITIKLPFLRPSYSQKIYTHAPLARWCPTLMRDMRWYATNTFQPSFLSFQLACFINFAFHFIQIVLFLVRYFQMPCIDASLQTIGQRRLRVAAPPAPDVLVSFPPFVPSC